MTEVRMSPALARGLLTRRTLMRGLGAAALGVALAGCGSAPANRRSTAERAATDMSDQEKIVNWSNWPEYIDVDDKTQRHPTIEAFTRQTGIKVNYTEDVNDNDEFFAKVRPQLAAGQDTGRDLMILTDYMVARLIRFGWIQELDKANIPNAKTLEPALRDVPFDPGRRYSLPWQTGFVGIAYNPKATGGKKIESVEQLLHDPVLKGKVTLLTEMRDTVGLVVLALGKNPADFTDADFDAALAAIRQAKASGQLKGFTGNEYGKGLVSGDIAACFAWAGDVVQLKADNPDLQYVLPKAGHMMFSDNFVIPNKARHKKNAEKLINYYYDPGVMAQVVEYINYISPVSGSKQILLDKDPGLAQNPLIFPSAEVMGRAHVFKSLTPEEESKYNRAFQEVIGG